MTSPPQAQEPSTSPGGWQPMAKLTNAMYSSTMEPDTCWNHPSALSVHGPITACLVSGVAYHYVCYNLICTPDAPPLSWSLGVYTPMLFIVGFLPQARSVFGEETPGCMRRHKRTFGLKSKLFFESICYLLEAKSPNFDTHCIHYTTVLTEQEYAH